MFVIHFSGRSIVLRSTDRIIRYYYWSCRETSWQTSYYWIAFRDSM